LKAMLNKYIYKSNKEFYVCNLDIIIKKILKCIKIEKNDTDCKVINNDMIGGSNNNIIDKIISMYKQKYDYYYNIYNTIKFK